mgnify:FL=1
MAGKKSFTGQQNPALAFISAQEPEGGAEDKKRLQIETRPLHQREEAEASSAAHVKTTDAPEGFKANPLFVETKSRRMQLLVQPSLYDAIKARATAEGQSVNELVHSILEAAIKGG